MKENIPGIVNKGPVNAVSCEQLAEYTSASTWSSATWLMRWDSIPTEVALKNDGYEGHDMIPLRAEARYGKPDRDSLTECIEAGKS